MNWRRSAGLFCERNFGGVRSDYLEV